MEENVAYENKKYSYADLEKINDDKRYEIIDGNLYLMSSPSVTHQAIAGEIYKQLSIYLDGKKCQPFIAPLDVALSKSKKSDKIFNVVQPDVFVICNPEKIEDNKIFGAPEFVVEILSSSDKRHDRLYKFNLYQKYKVKEYWIVDPFEKSIFPYLLNEQGFYLLNKGYDLEEEVPVKVLSGCKICLKEFIQKNRNLVKEIEEEYKY